MRKIVLLILLAILPLCASADLEYCSPESQGLGSEHLSAYFNAMMSTKDCEVHHIVVLRHGKIIGEISPKPFQSNDQHTLYSASKTFVSTAVGLAIAEGKLNLTDRVIDFFPNSLPDSISNELRTMNVRHLLTMTSGIKPDWVMRNKNRDWVACFLKKEVKTPGMEFQYDSMVTYLLAGIVQKVTGKKLIEYLNQKLFAPMEIQDAEWEESPEGINTGGWGLRISTISMAKFGQLLLNKGKWEGKQLVPADWVKEMCSKQQTTQKLETYGYQTWQCDYPDVFRADGAFGQYIIVAPNEDMVIAITQANLSNGLPERHLVWKHLLKNVSDSPWVEGKAYNELKKSQMRFMLPTAQGAPNSSSDSPLLGKTLQLAKNNPLEWQSIHLEANGEKLMIKIVTQTHEEYTLEACHHQWNTVPIDAYPPYSIKAQDRFKGLSRNFTAASCYGWEGNDRLNVNILFTNWISGVKLTLISQNGEIVLWAKENTKKEATKIKIVKKTAQEHRARHRVEK